MRPIGGYFSLELSVNKSFHLNDGVLLNSGRNAFEYILRAHQVKSIRIPYFTCDVLLEPLNKLGVEYAFYHINEQLEIADDITLSEGEYLLVTNYYGIKDFYISTLVRKYKDKLIVDNAQALYAPHNPLTNSFYSPRKYVGIPDGGIAFSVSQIDNDFSQDISYDRCSHLLGRIDMGASAAYHDFKENSRKLMNQDIQLMSNLTQAFIDSIDFNAVRQQRLKNFSYLHSELAHTNKFIIPSIGSFACPMVYPYKTEDTSLRKKLIDNKVFVATYWPNVFEWCNVTDTEYQLADKIIAIPIDQRYGIEDMKMILELMK